MDTPHGGLFSGVSSLCWVLSFSQTDPAAELQEAPGRVSPPLVALAVRPVRGHSGRWNVIGKGT